MPNEQKYTMIYIDYMERGWDGEDFDVFNPLNSYKVFDTGLPKYQGVIADILDSVQLEWLNVECDWSPLCVDAVVDIFNEHGISLPAQDILEANKFVRISAYK